MAEATDASADPMPHSPVPTAEAAAAAVVSAVKAVAFATASAQAVPARTPPAFSMLSDNDPKSATPEASQASSMLAL